MVDETTQQPSTPEAPAPAAEQQPEASGADTPESIEAYWRKRQSNSDKAHAEEARVLREQLAAYQATQAGTGPKAAQGGSDAAAALQRQNADLQRQLKESEQQRLVDTRRAMYPNAVQALEDQTLISQMDEARLAALNAKLTDAPPPAPRAPMDANNPQRGRSAPPKDFSEMSKDELLDVMAREASDWTEQVRNS